MWSLCHLYSLMVGDRMKGKRKRGYRVLLNRLLALGIVQLCIFHLYFWNYTLYMLDFTSFDPSNDNVIDQTTEIYDKAYFNKILKEEKGSSGGGKFDLDKMEMIDIVKLHSKSRFEFPLFDAFHVPKPVNLSSIDPNAIGVQESIRVLENLGIHIDDLDQDRIHNIPPWSQIISNFGNEAVILGLERCEAYRERVPASKRSVGPAGLFSSGTNVLHNLLLKNCIPPTEMKFKSRTSFDLWQVPWGKHNPAEARMHFATEDRIWMNQTTVMPVVAIRHPITWLFALCQHSYSLLWPHNPTMCDSALELKQKVRAAFGYKTMQYNSLIHVWRDWYSDYFEERRYPLLMIRLEDVIYRPKQVVEKVCECVGGTFNKANFIVHDEVANIGKGHGKHRSNLIDTFIKHGKPLKSYHQKFHAKDWKIIRKVLQKDYGMLEAFNYQLFH